MMDKPISQVKLEAQQSLGALAEQTLTTLVTECLGNPDMEGIAEPYAEQEFGYGQDRYVLRIQRRPRV